MKINIHSIILFSAAFLFLIQGCGPSVPTDTDVQKYLQPIVPKWLSINKIQTKSFMDGNTGMGRTSVTLTLVTTDIIFRQASQKDIELELTKFNLAIDDLEKFDPKTSNDKYFSSSIQRRLFFITSHQKGEKISGTFDLTCQEKVQGWAFDGSLDISEIKGQPKSAVPPSAIMLGTPESERYFGEFADKKKAGIARKDKYINGLKSYFAKGQKHDGKFCLGCTNLYPITLTLIDNPIFESKADDNLKLKVECIIHWNSEMPKHVSNTPAKQDHKVLLTGDIYAPERENDQLTAIFYLFWYTPKEEKYIGTFDSAKLVGSVFDERGYQFSLDPVKF